MGLLLTSAERQELEALAKGGPSAAVRQRAQLLLLYDEGLPTVEVAQQAGLSTSRTRYWKAHFQRNRMATFHALPGDTDASASRPLAASPSQAAADAATTIFDAARQIFRATSSLHHLPEPTLELLRSAAGRLARRKTAAAKEPPVEPQDVNLNSPLEQTIRYLRGKPERLRKIFPSLPREEQQAVILAAILRMALALTTTPQFHSKIVSIELTSQTLRLHLAGPRAAKDAQTAVKTSRLWQELFDQDVIFETVAASV